jgi:hypothetical protein
MGFKCGAHAWFLEKRYFVSRAAGRQPGHQRKGHRLAAGRHHGRCSCGSRPENTLNDFSHLSEYQMTLHSRGTAITAGQLLRLLNYPPVSIIPCSGPRVQASRVPSAVEIKKKGRHRVGKPCRTPSVYIVR